MNENSARLSSTKFYGSFHDHICPWDDGNTPNYTDADAGAATDNDQSDVGAAVDYLGRACGTESRNTSRTISGTTILSIAGGFDTSVEVIQIALVFY